MINDIVSSIVKYMKEEPKPDPLMNRIWGAKVREEISLKLYEVKGYKVEYDDESI